MASLKKADPVFSPAVLEARLFGPQGFAPKSLFAVALSGGLDSVVLLHALGQLRESHPFSLRAIHVHHGLHADADRWAQHCLKFCERLGVACAVLKVSVDRDHDEGLEAAARRARYDALAQSLDAGETLLTAHHRDDQAETLLLHLVRGAGVAGLAAMSGHTAFADGMLARPLLDTSRASLEAYARAQALEWIEDPSNTDESLRRNFLRHTVLPQLRARWPAVEEALARCAQHADEARGLLDEIGLADLAPADTADGLDITVLRSLSPARLHNALRCWFRRDHWPAPDTQQLAALTALLQGEPATRHGILRIGPVEVHRYRDRLMQLPVLAAIPDDLHLDWRLTTRLALPAGGELAALPAEGEGIAARWAGAPMTVRFREGGERCRLPGRDHSQRVKKLLQARGVPPWQRERLPFLYHDEALVAVADLWVCEPYACRPGEPGLRLAWRPISSPTGDFSLRK
jgi:tRNA(Ile)-lysidine synthase